MRRLYTTLLLLPLILSLLILLLSGQSLISTASSFTPPPTNTPRPTRTPTATRTPTNTATPPPTMVIMGTYDTPVKPPVTMIPPMMPTPIPSGDDVVTVLLLGSDTISHNTASRTDVMILLAIDRTTQTVSMLHIPRDLYVYIPNDTMDKINTVMNYGNMKYGDGEGAKLLRETIEYNLGVKIDFYARIDFVEFQDIIGKLGGLDIGVDCAVQDYRLKSPDLPYNDPNSWELYTLPVGYHKLSPYMALWYVRSRVSSNDYDRGLRQIDVLRAIWRQAKQAGIFTQVTQLWPDAQNLVETDMTLTDILGLVPVAAALDPEKIQRFNVTEWVDVKPWYTTNNGEFVLIPDRARWTTLIQNMMQPPPTTRLNGETPTVEIGAAQPLKGYDQVAADRLSWEGFATTAIGTEGVTNRDLTVIYDYTGDAKPESLKTLMKVLRVNETSVIQKPDPNRTVDFRVEMGKNYGTCLRAMPGLTPTPDLTPTAGK